MISRNYSKETKKVWEHHISSWYAGDIDAIMADFAEDSRLILNGKVYEGIEKIRGHFDYALQTFANGELILNPEVIEGEVIYIYWYFTPRNDNEYFGTCTFVVKNGIIKCQTLGSALYEKYPVELYLRNSKT